MQKSDWRPSAGLAELQARARLLQSLRAFFSAHDYLEVDTPILARAAATDPNIESIHISDSSLGSAWLQSSPEFAMKRLLAAGSGRIFQICHSFRDGEAGRWHNPEFSMLEWYRPGFDHAQLMDEVELLLRTVTGGSQWSAAFERKSYRDCFLERLAIDPFTCTLADLQNCARVNEVNAKLELDRDGWLDLLMGHCVGPQLGLEAPCFVLDYPASQAALARIRREAEVPVASRFELYWKGLELANGFHELSDADEQRGRFKSDQVRRAGLGQAVPPYDDYLLSALQAGLPDCAGVALGIDRLLALLEGKSRLAEVLAFPADRV